MSIKDQISEAIAADINIGGDASNLSTEDFYVTLDSKRSSFRVRHGIAEQLIVNPEQSNVWLDENTELCENDLFSVVQKACDIIGMDVEFHNFRG